MNAILNCPSRVLQVVAVMIPLVAFAVSAHADIFQWEYINPADPSQGKQKSTTLAPDGAGVDAVPGADLQGHNFTMAYLIGSDLTRAEAYQANLTNADLSQANLTNAEFTSAMLTGANLSHANLDSAEFGVSKLKDADFTSARVNRSNLFAVTQSGFTAAQLYSTASFQAHDLTGIQLWDNDLSGWNFAGQNLTNSYFDGATLTGGDFTSADVRGASLSGTQFTLAQLYSTASYQAHDLTGIGLSGNDLSGANFAAQNLNSARLDAATLTDANFTSADIRGADFARGSNCSLPLCGPSTTGITLQQLYSTTSYQAHDLTGVGLGNNNLAGATFAGQNLTNARFNVAILTGADFTDAVVRGTNFGGNANCTFFSCWPSTTGIAVAQLYSTASYQAHDLTGVGLGNNNLAGGNFTDQNLTNAQFYKAALIGANFARANLANAVFAEATLVNTNFAQTRLINTRFSFATLWGADFSGADVRWANFELELFGGTGISAAQLYATASYQAHDLSGIDLTGNDLAGANFVGQHLANARLDTSFIGGAVIHTDLTGADFTGADTRRAGYRGSRTFAGAITSNMIWSNGHIDGLDLFANSLLVVRDYVADPRYEPVAPPIPITVDQHLAMGQGGTLRMVFEADAWDSTISFASGIPVTLGGTLELTFATDVNIASQLGRTFDVFDWTGVNPIGAFGISSPYTWDLSNLYTTGEITLTAVPEPRAILLFSVALTALVAIGRARLSFVPRKGDDQ